MSLVNFIREVKHDIPHLWALGFTFVFGKFIALAQRLAFQRRRSGSLSKNSYRTEAWIDLSGMDRFDRLVALGRLADLECKVIRWNKNRLASSIFAVLAITVNSFENRSIVRIFCRSGDQSLWLVLLLSPLKPVILDIYDTRPHFQNFLRKALERKAIQLSTRVSCRDLRLSSGMRRRVITHRKRDLILDPPFIESPIKKEIRELKFEDLRIINVGWVGPLETFCPMIETYKLLLETGVRLTVLPSISQSWNDPALRPYKELSERYHNLNLLEPVSKPALKELLIQNDFGLLASDWEWNVTSKPSWMNSDDSPQREHAIRLSDYIGADLGVITCRYKWFARKFAMRYACSVLYLDDIRDGHITQSTLVRVGRAEQGRFLLVDDIIKSLKHSHTRVRSSV